MDAKERVSLGFDIGIASVGWSVVSIKTGKVLETGVSIFPEADAEKNSERRGFRQGRRLLRRRKNRIADLKKLLKEKEFKDFEGTHHDNLYELRVKALDEKIDFNKIALILLQIAKHRGISYELEDADVDVDKSVTASYKKGLAVNQKLLQHKTPGQIQFERFKKYGKVHGLIEDDANRETLMNVFPTSSYIKEVKKILETQQNFYSELDDEFISKVIKIISRKRDYFVGPGSEKSRTDYGIYRTDGTTLKNLFEILIGKDKIFPDEYRAAGNSYTAQVFNLLNDLNNLRVAGTEDGKLTKEHKEKILNYLKTTDKTVYMLRLIAKTVGIDISQIKGYRIDKDNKPEFHSLTAFRRARKALKKEEIDLLDFPVAFLDDLGRILTLNTENGEIRKALNEPEFKAKYQFLNEDLIDKLIENKAAFNLSSNNKWHRFSLKTMKLLIPEMMATSKEQMTILNDMGLLKQDERDYSNKDQIDIKILQDEIYNPVVRKSVKQTIKIFNALWKKYNKEIAYVVVEMPREKNSADAKKRKDDNQKKYKKEKDESFKSFRELTGLSEEGLENKINKFHQLSLMIRLWYQQEGRCPYSGKSIDPEDLLYKSALFQIDHIIPLSVSLDDGLNNKVLCYADMNQQKAKQTPYAFMQSGKGQGFEKLTAYVKNNNRLPGNKKRNLLNTDDLNDIETRKRFIARNLVDTRYASRVVLNELQAFINSKETNVKVSVIRGKLTHKLREKWNLEKSRETHYHHAVDASIIAVTPKLKLWKQAGYSLFPDKVEEQELNIGIGEIVSDNRFAELVYTLPFEETYLDQLRHLEPRIKFKHQVDKKMNRKVSKATIYGTRMAKTRKDKKESRYYLGKIKNIYSLDGYKSFRKIYDKDKSKFLMYQKDSKTFDKLEKILKDYPDSNEFVQQSGKVKKVAADPFELYRQENGLIRKYSKKNDGPIIRSMKYYDSKVGVGIDVTPKNSRNKVILQSLNPWRTDVYYNHEKQDYEIMGLKYNDLKFFKDSYGILWSDYKDVKSREGVSENSEFIFSLYRNDRIKVIDTENNLSEEFLFGSRTNPSMKNYVELKPIDRSKFGSKEEVKIYGKVAPNGQFIKRFTKKGFKVYKVNTDELGNPFYLKKEANFPKDIIDK